MLLDETIEAVGWRDRRVLSASAMSSLAKDLQRIVGQDPAAGDGVMKSHLRAALQGTLLPGSRHVRSLRELSALIQEGYLRRWATRLDLEQRRPSPERLARAVSSHLLDRGYSMPYLHRWARSLLREKRTLGEVMESAISLAEATVKQYEVVLPFLAVPKVNMHLRDTNPAWRNASQIREWLREYVGDPKGVRQAGGFTYTFYARDAVAAAYLGARNVERIISRSTLANRTARHPEPEGRIWVKGYDRPILIPQKTGNALVRSLATESLLFDLQQNTGLDDALELLAAMNASTPGPAIASGWAAIESLLVSATDPDDSKQGRGLVAGDRVATLVACSWPRADLTTLSYRHRPPAPDKLSVSLSAAPSNRERSRLIASALVAGKALALKEPNDYAAEARMLKLMKAPFETLKDVKGHVATAMRRLYRQRNIVMHGGTTGTLTLEATLRTCAPLVGAALDRITHAQLTANVDPLQLSSKAEVGFRLLKGAKPPHVVDLLE